MQYPATGQVLTQQEQSLQVVQEHLLQPQGFILLEGWELRGFYVEVVCSWAID